MTKVLVSFDESVNMYGTKCCIMLTVYGEMTGKCFLWDKCARSALPLDFSSHFQYLLHGRPPFLVTFPVEQIFDYLFVANSK